jgi:hypothetical protein
MKVLICVECSVLSGACHAPGLIIQAHLHCKPWTQKQSLKANKLVSSGPANPFNITVLNSRRLKLCLHAKWVLQQSHRWRNFDFHDMWNQVNIEPTQLMIQHMAIKFSNPYPQSLEHILPSTTALPLYYCSRTHHGSHPSPTGEFHPLMSRTAECPFTELY